MNENAGVVKSKSLLEIYSIANNREEYLFCFIFEWNEVFFLLTK